MRLLGLDLGECHVRARDLYAHDSQFRQKPPRGPFLWLTQKGELKRPHDMASPHVYYALRMLFNHSVPPEFRTPVSIHPVKLYADVFGWSAEYRRAAINALSDELRTRNLRIDLDQTMRDGLRWMNMAARLIAAMGI